MACEHKALHKTDKGYICIRCMATVTGSNKAMVLEIRSYEENESSIYLFGTSDLADPKIDEMIRSYFEYYTYSAECTSENMCSDCDSCENPDTCPEEHPCGDYFDQNGDPFLNQFSGESLRSFLNGEHEDTHYIYVYESAIY